MCERGEGRKDGGITPKRGREKIIPNNQDSAGCRRAPTEDNLRRSTVGKGRVVRPKPWTSVEA